MEGGRGGRREGGLEKMKTDQASERRRRRRKQHWPQPGFRGHRDKKLRGVRPGRVQGSCGVQRLCVCFLKFPNGEMSQTGVPHPSTQAGTLPLPPSGQDRGSRRGVARRNKEEPGSKSCVTSGKSLPSLSQRC